MGILFGIMIGIVITGWVLIRLENRKGDPDDAGRSAYSYQEEDYDDE